VLGGKDVHYELWTRVPVARARALPDDCIPCHTCQAMAIWTEVHPIGANHAGSQRRRQLCDATCQQGLYSRAEAIRESLGSRVAARGRSVLRSSVAWCISLTFIGGGVAVLHGAAVYPDVSIAFGDLTKL
jgi:hypothetical protein